MTEFAPINPVPESVDAARDVVDARPDDVQRLARLLTLADGFETPYSLELLATVHYASTRMPATTLPSELSDRVASWSLRKARLFNARHVELASRRLAEHRLLAV